MNNRAALSLFGRIVDNHLRQLLLSQLIKLGLFKLPIHLGVGGEHFAVAIMQLAKTADSYFLTHRNVNYNLAALTDKQFVNLIHNYFLISRGEENESLGCMNQINLKKNILYSSSILGNNLGVAAGAAEAVKLGATSEVPLVFATTGDGAIEEGIFWETLIMASSRRLPFVVILENNDWSLQSVVDQRRGKIDVKRVADGLGISFMSADFLDKNILSELASRLGLVRTTCKPLIVELGINLYGHTKITENNRERTINYHQGKLPCDEFDRDRISCFFSERVDLELDRKMINQVIDQRIARTAKIRRVALERCR